MHGIVYMVAAIGLLSTMDALAKWLIMDGVTVMQILALRSLVIIPLLLLVYASRGQLSGLKPRRTDWHFYRGAIGFMAPLCFFLGIRHIPLTDAVTVSFSSIFIITLLSMLFLGEQVGLHRWASILAGFIGVVVIAGFQGGGELSGYLLVLAGSTAYATLFVSGRYLTATESVASLVLSYNLCVGVISLVLMPWFWQPLSAMHYTLILILALLAVSGQYLSTLAFSVAQASLIAPFEYTAVLWALGFDMLVWQTLPSMATTVGALIIIGSGLYLVHRERIRQYHPNC